MHFIIIDNGEKTQRRLKNLLGTFGSYVIMPANQIDKDKIKSTDVLILSGGNQVEVLRNKQHYADEIDLIKTHPGLIIGICLGMQLIASVYEAPVVQRDRGLVHRRTIIRPTMQNPLINTPQKVWQNHKFAVRAAPRGFDVLARSNSDIEIIKHRTRPIWATQFHPEVSGQVGLKIISGILNDK